MGNTVFATKIYHTLDLINQFSEQGRKDMANFIKSFQKKDSSIYDPLIKRKTFLKDKLSAIKNLNFNNFSHQQTIRAETRQSISALKLLKDKPGIPYQNFPKTEEEIENYLSKLNWQKPWAAGSHFSPLLFFLENSEGENKEGLITFAINWVNKLQNSQDGSWYKGRSTQQQKINEAMKIITGLKVVERVDFNYPEKLIDLCLSAKNDDQSCDNFNIVYVLKYAKELTQSQYRYSEIKNFALDRLEIYQRYYFPEIGGFPFFPNKANQYYYVAKITKELNSPDIHGTCMFLWGISIISQILGIDKKLKFKEQIP